MRKAARFFGDLWYLMKPYFGSAEWKFAWTMLVLLVALNLANVGLGLVLSFSRNIFYNALQAKDASAFFRCRASCCSEPCSSRWGRSRPTRSRGCRSGGADG